MDGSVKEHLGKYLNEEGKIRNLSTREHLALLDEITKKLLENQAYIINHLREVNEAIDIISDQLEYIENKIGISKEKTEICLN